MKQTTQIKITTSDGEIILELYPGEAPITVANFLEYVESGHYENTVFHRVMEDFMIQGGGFTQDGKEKSTKKPIKLESDNGLKNKEYTIAMARTSVPDSATSQFFINTKDNDFLDYNPQNEGYAVFGKVIQGQEIINVIKNKETTNKNGMPDWPVEDILILKVEVL